MSLLGSTSRTAGRLTPWARTIAIAEMALILKRHIDRLEAGEGTELRQLIVKSKGRPGNLTSSERARVFELVKKLEPTVFARSAAVKAAPLRRR